MLFGKPKLRILPKEISKAGFLVMAKKKLEIEMPIDTIIEN